MNYEVFEKALTNRLMNPARRRSSKKQRVESVRRGHLYTIYQQEKRSINIGFTYDIDKLNLNINKITFNKIGSPREERIVKQTLRELGHFPKSDSNTYSYSYELIKHLRVMGWPTGPKENKKLKN